MGQIVFRLSEVMQRHGIRQRQLAVVAKVRPAAINALYHGNRERVNVAHLVAILDGLYTLTGHIYTVADLLEYTTSGDAKTLSVSAHQLNILERVSQLERSESNLIPIEEVAAKYGITL
jgi:transcriptional regulator with XRE-family HTH domain